LMAGLLLARGGSAPLAGFRGGLDGRLRPVTSGLEDGEVKPAVAAVFSFDRGSEGRNLAEVVLVP
jgi:hypothetical protein